MPKNIDRLAGNISAPERAPADFRANFALIP